MPLPNNERVIALSEALLQQLDTMFGLHPGFRPAHAKGMMLTGKFTPSPDASYLSRAPHLNRESTPVTVRFSNSPGIPVIPDNSPNASPRGIAIRFHIGEHEHTDIIGHSTNGFPSRTGEEFLEFLRAAAASDPSKPSPSPIEVFLGSHPKALAFVQTPKPIPSTFADESFFGVTAMRFVNKDGLSHFVRYRILPQHGNHYLSDTDAAARGENFLFDELKERVSGGPITFGLVAQIASREDVVDDSTIQWPESRTQTELGKIVLTAPVADNGPAQQQIIFDPIPRVDGIEPSEDPLLELRAAIYLISGRRRRAARK